MIAKELNARQIPGVSFDSTMVTVEQGQKWGGHRIPMIAIAVTDRNAVHSYRVCLEMLRAIYVRHKGEFQWRTGSIDRLSGSTRARDAVELGRIQTLMQEWERESQDFQSRSAPYLLYQPR
jgi:uncharacterized protein YbbC (DUF1343 family)